MYEARGITVRYGHRVILDAVDFALTPGRVVAIVGPNGVGKSTLLRIMAGERRPESGTVLINGRDVTTLPAAALAAERAVLAQSLALSAPFTVDEVVRLGIAAHVRRGDAEALVARALAAIDLPAAAGRPVTELSGGEQQRIHTARVLAQLWSHAGGPSPRYLLLDEPTAHLDPAHQRLLMKLARAEAAAGVGVLVILHDLSLAAAAADEVVLLGNGRVAGRGAPADLFTPTLMAEVYGVPFVIGEAAGRMFVLPEMA